MFTFTRAVAAGALLAGAANAGDHFILTQVRTLSLTRIDPMITPGAPGPHAHLVLGASNFGPNSGSPDVLDQAKCSSTLIGDDKSSYWSPQVYYNHGNGSYSAMLSSTRIYYFLKPLNGTQPVVPFPRGFRMLAGGKRDSRPETYPPRGELSYDQQQELDPRINAIKWGCSAGAVQGQGNGGSLPGQRPYLPNDAPNGCGVLNAGVFFPSCSDGRLDSDDHFSHMRYPLDGPNGYKCPASHSTKFPTIFLENFYFPGANQPYRGANQDNWVLSNGDTLGLTYHADFINGWNQDTLTQTLQQCNTPNAPEANLEQCGPLAKSLSVDNADKCISEGQIADEPVGLVAPINALPGCNPIWPVEARTKPSCQANEVGIVQPSSRYTVPDFKISLPLAGGNGTSKVVAAPAGADPNAGYSSYYGSSSYASTSSAYAATSTYASAAASTTSTSEALAAAKSESSTASALPSTSASYNSDLYGSAPSSAYVASGSVTSSYAAASAEPSSYPSSESSSSNSESQAPTNYPSSYAPGAQAPSGYPGSQASTTYAAPAGATSQASSSTSSAATSTAAPQRGNVAGGGPGHPKTCHRKGKGKGKKTHARREWQSRLLH